MPRPMGSRPWARSVTGWRPSLWNSGRAEGLLRALGAPDRVCVLQGQHLSKVSVLLTSISSVTVYLYANQSETCKLTCLLYDKDAECPNYERWLCHLCCCDCTWATLDDILADILAMVAGVYIKRIHYMYNRCSLFHTFYHTLLSHTLCHMSYI
jgi:hypothetical protein